MTHDSLCPFCNTPLNGDEHGNRTYCENGDECYYAQKKLRSNKDYWDRKNALLPFQKADLILKSFFNLYEVNSLIPAVLLDGAGFEWSICLKEITIEGNPAKQMGKYAYCLFENEKIKIWKL